MMFAKKILALVILASFIGAGINVSTADAKRRHTYTTQKININKRFVPADKIPSLVVPATLPDVERVNVPDTIFERPREPVTLPVPELVPEISIIRESAVQKDTGAEYFENFIPVQEYILGIGDQINVTVVGADELSGEYKVQDDGTIVLPWIGDIDVQGLTLHKILGQIEDKLKDGYLKNPDVSIEMPVSRPFYVLGEVNNPGSYTYSHGMSLFQAIEMSGGFTSRANQKSVDILHGNAEPQKPTSTPLEYIMKSGDVVFVREQSF